MLFLVTKRIGKDGFMKNLNIPDKNLIQFFNLKLIGCVMHVKIIHKCLVIHVVYYYDYYNSCQVFRINIT